MQLQQKLHEQQKNPDLGQFTALEQFPTLATAFQAAKQCVLQLSGDSANFSYFFAQARKSFGPRTYVQQLEERLSRLDQKPAIVEKFLLNLHAFTSKISNIAK